MNKSLKRNILIVTIILSLAIVFVPIYIFVLADAGDDDKFTVVNKKITEMIDGTESFDADDLDGNDSSGSNKRVRTFDSIKYTVSYELIEKTPQSTSGNIEGRKLLVEVLIPTSYEAVLKYGEEVTVNMDERSEDVLTIDGNTYYYAGFDVPVASLGTTSAFNFSLKNINTTDITTSNSIKPLIFIKEKTDTSVGSVKTATTLPTDITCELTANTTDPQTGSTTTTTDNNCNVTITGKEDYFVNMYSGSKNENTIPIGLLIGLRNVEGKGIKGLIVPKNLSFTISNSDSTKLTFNENSEKTYKTYTGTGDYKINIDEHGNEMPEINNGDITSSITDGVLTINVNNIKDYLISSYGDQYSYFSTNYFLTTLAARSEYDYSDINITLTSSKNNSSNTASTVQIFDSFDYIVGNYSSNIDVYESSLTSESISEALEYGKANINYGSDFVLKTKFDYNSRTDSSGNGLVSLTNYIKIDNDIFELHNDTSNNGYKFVPGETTSTSRIKLDVDNEDHPKVYFGFGEWNSTYFDIAQNAPSGCPTSISGLSKEVLMNLYGGPCIVTKDTVKWAFSPVAENDISGNPITSTKGPMIVMSTYVSYDGQYIAPGSTGTIELYGTVEKDNTKANNAYMITTCATAYGKSNTDFRYLGNEAISGESLLTRSDNFVKTSYNFDTRTLNSLNTNLCGNNRCPVTGATILVSGIKSTKPQITSHKATDLTQTENHFYYYPLAFKINANAVKSDTKLRFNAVYVDLYLPSYMNVITNYGISNEKIPVSTEDTTLANIYAKLNKGTPTTDVNYKVYHYIVTAETQGLTEEEITNLQQGILSNFVVYADIDSIATPNAATPEVFTTVDFNASLNINNTAGGVTTFNYKPITPDVDRTSELNPITLYNSFAVITKAATTPKHIEKNGSYTFTMLAYNHSSSVVDGGYEFPEDSALYYVLPYNGDVSTEMSSNIGTTKYKVNLVGTLPTGYKYYYATTGTPSNIISDELRASSEPSAIWKTWTNPNTPVSDVIAIKIVKEGKFAPNTYFGSEQGFTVNVETVGSSDGNVFYNSFHLLTKKPDNYLCTPSSEDPDYCTESKQLKANYASSSSVTSVYAREISGYVFEDYDYNGIYTGEESKLKDIPVSLYKIEAKPENYDPTDPTTFVKETDTLVGATVTGENGNYYFGGLSSGVYYVSYTIDNTKYIVTDIGKIDDNIPDSKNNNSSAALLPNTNKAISQLIEFNPDSKEAELIKNNINLGLAIKKEMAISLNKYITEVTVTKNGRTETYDYSNQNLSQVSITVLNPKNTTVRVRYSFSIENTKYFPGYVGMIVDSMPKDMTFDPNIKENQYWVMYGDSLYYNGLSGKLLLPNEKQYFSLILDLNLKEAGTYRNVVSAKDITLMGEELPVYDFSGFTNSTNSTQGGE